MNSFVSTTLAFAAALSWACELPTDPLTDNISEYFQIQVQNATRPDVHNQYMNLEIAGGGDRHLFIGGVGAVTKNLILVDGVIFWEEGGTEGQGIDAVINGEYSDIDETTKLFMTERTGDPRAYFQPTWACNPDTDEPQIELTFLGRQNDPAGGTICVRGAYDNSHEFRYYPPGNDKVDPDRPCIFVTLVALLQGDSPDISSSSTEIISSTSSSSISSSTSSSSIITSSSSTESSSSSSSSTSSETTPTATSEPSPFTDMTSIGFRYIGCAPEEGTVDPFDGAFRTLPNLYADDDMTNELCLTYCDTNGYAFGGTEYTRECWCGDSYAATREPGSTVESLAGCNYACGGDSTQYCGGAGWLSLYAKCDDGETCENAVFI